MRIYCDKMEIHHLAGKPAPQSMLIDGEQLISSYYKNESSRRIAFGPSGYRGSSLNGTFNEMHVMAIMQALCDYRKFAGINGPLFLGKDTHLLSEPAHRTALEVLAGNGVEVFIQDKNGYTPTPANSYAILTYNKGRNAGLADGIILTSSHNPPCDGGIKYHPPHGGPANTKIIKSIEARGNQLLINGCNNIKTIPFEKAIKAPTTHPYDHNFPYVKELTDVIDMEGIKYSGLKIGVDTMGGAGIALWELIADMYNLDIEIVNKVVDPTFGFVNVDKDGQIRMDCSSPYAMANLIRRKDKYDIAVGNDTDSDRHGIVTKSRGLMNPNNYLSVAISYLFQNRPEWGAKVAIGKTAVSSSMLDRIAKHLRRKVSEVPVGFAWFVDGLLNASYGFCGEESAGASFLRRNGAVWTTDKDGIILSLLAAEITAVTGRDPGEHYQALIDKFGNPTYERIDVKATPKQKNIIKELSPHMFESRTLADENVLAKLVNAPGNNAAIEGIKIITEHGWFAVRSSATEDMFRIYAESFLGKTHLTRVLTEAQAFVTKVFKNEGP